MGAPIGEFSARVLVPPSEFVVAARPAFRLAVIPGEESKGGFGHRSLPQVPVESFWGLSQRDFGACGCPADMACCFLNFSDAALLEQRDGLDKLPAGSLLGPDLDDASGFFADLTDRSAFGDRQCHRFLAVNILAGEHRLDKNFRMPVVWGRDMDDIDFWIVQDGSIV